MTATKIDPITTEIIRNSFISIAEDMNAALIRSAYSWIIYEALDCAVALIDSDHKVLAHSSGLPLFLGNLEACVDYTEERFGRNAWQPGDAWVMNDSYIGGTHLNDVTVVAPIFVDDDLVGFAASRAHHMDIGAKDPGGTTDSTEIYQEGMRLEPIRLVEGGRLREDVVQLMALNSRLPNQLVGDLKAQLSVGTIAERRYAELLRRYGRETVAAAREAIFKQTEQLDRNAVQRIPDGMYEAEGSLDGDGLTDTPCAVKVRIKVDGDQMLIDLTESGDAAAGPVNCGRSQAIASCRLAFKRMINPDQPVNGGSFAPLEVDGPRGEPARSAGAVTVLVVLHATRPLDRPRDEGSRAGPAGARGRSTLRGLVHHDLCRHGPALESVLRRSASPRWRLGGLEWIGW